MKNGRTLTELAAEIQRQADAKRDYIAPARTLAVEPNTGANDIILTMDGRDERLPLTDHAHGQLASYTDIPKAYYDRMRAADAGLLATNVNRWLQSKPRGESRMVRTLDGRARAVLSNSYKRVDHDVMAEAMLPLVLDGAFGNMTVDSCEVTERRLYVKLTSQDLVREVKVGDAVAFGFAFGNCEVGGGSYFAELFIKRLVCMNGMRVDMGVRRAHLGRRIESGDEASELYQTDTIVADERALRLKLRDTVRGLLSPPSIEMAFSKFQRSTESEPVEVPDKAVEVLGKRLALNETERGSVLKHLALGGDLTKWGVANAITRASADVPSYDRASEMESLGWDVIELPDSAWRTVAQAA